MSGVTRALRIGDWPLWVLALGLFTSSFLLHSLGTWQIPLTYADESRFAEATREMRERGDWIVPHFNGDYRFDKPPLTYWLQAAAFFLLGEGEGPARIHSVISASLLGLVVFGFGSRLYHPQAGLWAAIMLMTTCSLFVHAKASRPDVLMVLFMTTASWTGWELARDRRTSPPYRCLWWWGFWLSLAFAFLAKGPVGWLPLLSLPALAWGESGSHFRRRFRFPAGLTLMIGVVALWGVPALILTGGQFFEVGIGLHVAYRLTHTMHGMGPESWQGYLAYLSFYFITVFFSLAPWSVGLPWLARNLWRERCILPVERWLLTTIGSVFLIFTFSSTKLPLYIMPAFPLLLLLLAGRWLKAHRVGRIPVITISLTALAMVAISLFLTYHIPSKMLNRDIMRRLSPHLDPKSEFATVPIAETSQDHLVWYFRSYVSGFRHEVSPDQLRPFMNRPGPRFCVIPEAVADEHLAELPSEWVRLEVTIPLQEKDKEELRLVVIAN